MIAMIIRACVKLMEPSLMEVLSLVSIVVDMAVEIGCLWSDFDQEVLMVAMLMIQS